MSHTGIKGHPPPLEHTYVIHNGVFIMSTTVSHITIDIHTPHMDGFFSLSRSLEPPIPIAFYADALWDRHALLIPHERLLRNREIYLAQSQGTSR